MGPFDNVVWGLMETAFPGNDSVFPTTVDPDLQSQYSRRPISLFGLDDQAPRTTRPSALLPSVSTATPAVAVTQASPLSTRKATPPNPLTQSDETSLLRAVTPPPYQSTPEPPTKKRKVVRSEVTKKATEVGSTLLQEEATSSTKAAKKTIQSAPPSTIDNHDSSPSNPPKAIRRSTRSTKTITLKTSVVKTKKSKAKLATSEKATATAAAPTTENNDLVVDTNAPEPIATEIAAPTISDPTAEEVTNVAPSSDDSESPSDVSTFFPRALEGLFSEPI
jgi:hypothetical protein